MKDKNCKLNIKVYETLTSTNDEAKALLRASLDNIDTLKGTIIVAQRQTAGRGRTGRAFYSPKDSGIYFSLIYLQNKTHNDLITASVAVAVKRVIKKYFSIECKIKWVNDIYIEGKKVCGILTEGVILNGGKIGYIIGVGLNLYIDNTAPEEISTKACGILNSFTEGKRVINNKGILKQIKLTLIESIAEETYSLLEAPNKDDIIKEYKEASNILGKKITVHSLVNDKDFYEAVAVDITGEAKLVIEKESGERLTLESATVSLH